MPSYTIRETSLKGDGLVRLPQLRHTMYAPDSCPGDTISWEQHPEKKPFRIADYRITSPSKSRITPPCPHAGVCGGCSYQHIDYRAQLEIKTEQLLKLFPDHVNKQSAIIHPSPLVWRYRNRVTLHYKDKKLGFFARNKQSLIPFDGCLLLEKDIEEYALGLDPMPPLPELHGVTVFKDQNNVIASHYLKEKGEHADFLQVNSAVNNLLTAFIRSRLRKMSDKPAILDLYCGNGNLSLAIADLAGSVLGLDICETSIARANREARNSGYSHCSYKTFEVSKAREIITRQADSSRIMILDPPRRGLGREAGFLADLKLDQLFYISCNPLSLQRDLSYFLNNSYSIAALEGFDMFPHTPHLELAVHLTRRQAG